MKSAPFMNALGDMQPFTAHASMMQEPAGLDLPPGMPQGGDMPPVQGGVKKGNFFKGLLMDRLDEATKMGVQNMMGQNPNNQRVHYSGLPGTTTAVAPSPIASLNGPQGAPPQFVQGGIDPQLLELLRRQRGMY